MVTTYRQYLNRLTEWSIDYFSFVMIRLEFEDMLRHGMEMEEAFQMLIDLNSPPHKRERKID